MKILRSRPWLVAAVVALLHRMVCNLVLAGWGLFQDDVPLHWVLWLAWNNVPGGTILGVLTGLQYLLFAWLAPRIRPLGVLGLSAIGIPALLYWVDTFFLGRASWIGPWAVATGLAGLAAYAFWACLTRAARSGDLSALPTHAKKNEPDHLR